jgi:hypothetical protein
MLRSNQDIKNDLNALMWIHTLLSFAVIAVLLFFFGCKEIQEEQASLGGEVEAQSVIDALVLAQGDANPWEILKGEAVLYDYTQEVEGSPASLFLQVSQQVLQLEDVKDEDDNYLYLKVTYVGTEFDPETGEEIEISFSREYDPNDYGVTPTVHTEVLAQHDLYLQQMFEERSKASTASKPIIKESYHDLKIKQMRMAPPANVSARDNCGGVPNCELRITRLSYDKAEWTSSSEFQKISYEYDISIDPPYSGLIVRECIATQVKVESRKYFVRNCMSMKDFLYGQK